MSSTPVRFGLAGLGGFAAYMCDRLLAAGISSARPVQLVAVCDPELSRFPQRVSALQSHGILLLDRYEQLLEQEIEAVCLPLPIDLHYPYTQLALQAGKAVLCEKPAAGTVDEVDAMIAARDAANLPVAVGFQDCYQPAVHELKRRLLRGDFGVVLSASVAACAPRGDRYFRRNAWAGRISYNDRWILDSPAGNALAHYLHLAQFLLGTTLSGGAIPDEVEAELYRANPIENYDTCSLRLTFPGGSHVLASLTHACAKYDTVPMIVIRTEHARITYVPRAHIQITTSAITETLPLWPNPYPSMFQVFQKWVRNGPDHILGASLEMARAHSIAVNAASQAGTIHDIPPEFIDEIRDDRGFCIRCVRDLEPAIHTSAFNGRMLHESALLPWTKPASEISARNYSHFEGPGVGERQLEQSISEEG